MNDPFARLGAATVRWRWFVVVGWVVVLAAVGGFYAPKASKVLVAGGYFLPGSESDRAERILDREFNSSTASNLVVIFRSTDLTIDQPEYASQVATALARVDEVEGVRSVVSFFNTQDATLVTPDRRSTIAVVTMDGTEAEMQERVPDVREALDDVSIEHFVTGSPAVNYDLERVSEHDLRRSEMFTIPIILVLLVIVFRTVIAAAVPLVLGGCAVVLALAILAIVGEQTNTSIFAMNVASMIGLGLGIDFSLIVASRFRDELRAGHSTTDAMAITMATAGRSITYSGITVIMGMLVLTLLFGLMIVRSISLGVLIVSTCALALGLTLLPAMLAILGPRLEWLRVIPERRTPTATQDGFWYRLSHAIMRRPWIWLGVSLAILLVCAVPAIRLDLYGASSRIMPQSNESAAGVAALNDTFGANSLTPVQIVIQTDEENGVWKPEFLTALKDLSDRIAADPTVLATYSLSTLVAEMPAEQFAALSPEFFTASPERSLAASRFVNLQGENDTAVITVVSKFGQYDEEHETFVRDLRDETIPDVRQLRVYEVTVGGDSARYLDFQGFLYNRFPYLVVAVMVLTFIILMMFFQSLVLPLKAIFMNVASILATYGLLVVIFQWGYGASLLGFETIDRLGVFTPPILFAVLFGLSTDYEVFMLSRVKEYFHESGDNEEAVAAGLEHTAAIITAAGLILIGTFASFSVADVLTIKELGIGLAIGVLIDSTIVRVIMVPATMRLMGAANWWMPAWLKRIVPELREGPAPAPMPAPARAPASLPATAHVAPIPSAAVGAGPSGAHASQLGSDGGSPTAVEAQRRIAELHPIGGSVGVDVIQMPRHASIYIGRDEGSHLQIFDARISRYHARIDPVEGGYVVTDLQSTNGVFVNRERISQPTMLRDGDILEFGTMGTARFHYAERLVPAAQ